MAQQGWHLSRGGIVFTFVQGAAAHCRYRLDYRTETRDNLREYISLCKDAGWQHVCRFAGWHYFRSTDPKAPELHSNPASLAERYKKLLALLIVLLALNLSMFGTQRWPEGDSWGGFLRAVILLRAAVIVLLGYAVYRIASYSGS
jgi:hypothetical protein